MDEKDKIRDQVNTYYEFWFRINNIYHVWAQKHNMQQTTLFVLYIINENLPYCNQNMICDKVILPKQTVSLILSGLEKKGYILREANPKDRRNKIVKFTKQGKKYASSILEELKSLEIEAFSGIPEEKRLAVSEGFCLLSNLLGKVFLNDV